MRNCVYSDDIFDIAEDKKPSEIEDEVPAELKSSSLVDLRFDLGSQVRLVLLRKSRLYTDKIRRFTITLESVKSDNFPTVPAGLEAKITIKGERFSSSRTKIETSFSINHKSSFLAGSICEPLQESISESMMNIPLFCYENILQNNLAHFAMVQQNSKKLKLQKPEIREEQQNEVSSENLKMSRVSKEAELDVLAASKRYTVPIKEEPFEEEKVGMSQKTNKEPEVEATEEVVVAGPRLLDETDPQEFDRSK